MIEKLRLQPDDVLVDLGCGTGMYTVDILRQVTLHRPVLAVAPFDEMLAHIPAESDVVPVVDDAVSFSVRPGEYDKVLTRTHAGTGDLTFVDHLRLPDATKA